MPVNTFNFERWIAAHREPLVVPSVEEPIQYVLKDHIIVVGGN